MTKFKPFIILALCGTLAFSITGCSTANQDKYASAQIQASTNESSTLETIEGVVKTVEQGTDGISVIIQSNNLEYHTTISLVTTEIWGNLDKIHEGTKVIVTGELWDNESRYFSANKVEILDSKLDYVINLRATVKSVEPGKDGITAKIITQDHRALSATISTVCTDIPVGKIEDIKEGTKLWISGEVISLDTLHISSNIVLVNPIDASPKENESMQNLSQYEKVGEILAFEKDGVHIITGDLVEIFEVANEKSINNFFLGETVGVKKIGTDKFQLEKYKLTDFSIRHTKMGELITTISGKVNSIYENSFVIATEDGNIEFEAYDALPFKTGTEITVDYLKTNDRNILIDFYNENSKIDLNVKNIRRDEHTGTMLLDTEDKKGMKYTVYVSGSTVLNFNHSDLIANDKITVYPEVIRESYPAQIDAKMIKK